MEDFRLARDLVGAGLTHGELRSRVSDGRLQRVRRGAYAPSVGDEVDPADAHRLLLAATLAQGHPGAVVSHGSAAVLHGLPAPASALQRAHLTRGRAAGGQRRRWVQVHVSRLGAADVVVLKGRCVTSLARTVVDLACALPLRDAVAVGDAALRLGAGRAELAEVLERVGPRYRIASARHAIELLDARSESYGESVSRVLLIESGRAPEDLQLDVLDLTGDLAGRVDFAWPALGVIGEFDGRVKYGRKLAPGQKPEKALWLEKVREDLLRDLGWQVVRWIWADLDDPRAWFARLERAFARGHDLRLP
ncbi:MAG: hypothetical protein ACRYG2_03750 [Janthinobacterium lividum]